MPLPTPEVLPPNHPPWSNGSRGPERERLDYWLGLVGNDIRNGLASRTDPTSVYARCVPATENGAGFLDFTDAHELLRIASPQWPEILRQRRNGLRRWETGHGDLLPELPLLPEQIAAIPALSRRERNKLYPATNGADLGCGCPKCKALRAVTSGATPSPAFAWDAHSVERARMLATGRSFGVEIECYIPKLIFGERDNAGRWANFVGKKLRERGHPTGGSDPIVSWTLVSDDSMAAMDEFYKAELRSPHLRGEAGLAELAAMMTTLTAMGAKVTKQCGLHIHLAAHDLNTVELARVTSAFMRYERFFDLIMPQSRRSNRYCSSNRVAVTSAADEESAGHAILQIRKAKTRDEIVVAASGGSRHVKLNLHAIYAHGTVEFRQHSGTTNANKATHWARLLLNFVEIARTFDTPAFLPKPLTPQQEMERFFRTFRIPPKTRAFYRDRHAKLYANPQGDAEEAA